jgi:uncharacterized integral membrane protein
MFNKLTDKQCFQLLVFVVGILSVPVLLGSWAIIKWFFGEQLLGIMSIAALIFMAYKALQIINPDND